MMRSRSSSALAARSTPGVIPPPPGQWHDAVDWSCAEVGRIGRGLDGQMHALELVNGGWWTKVIG